MPKNKHVEEDSSNSSDSDSGPDNRNEKPQAKKSKIDCSKKLKNSEGDAYWELDRYKRVTVREFKGRTYIDIREYYENKSTGKIMPGKKGIAMNPALWNTLKSVMGEVDGAIKDLG